MFIKNIGKIVKYQKVYKLINSFLKGNTSKEEDALLNDFLNSYQSDDIEWKDAYGNRSEIEERLFRRIEKSISKKQKVIPIISRRNFALSFAAAAVACFIGATVFINFYSKQEENTLELEDKIVLKLSDGTTKIIDESSSQELMTSGGTVLGTQLKDKLSYKNTEEDLLEEKLVFNELFVPFGKKFEIELYDGTVVMLNSGSSLRYPVRFLKGRNREVYLNGEAYFSVSKDKRRAFKVHANSLITQVYGTEFNISAYGNEELHEVVLVEGSVGVTDSDSNMVSEILLEPNQKASVDKYQDGIIKQNVDVDNYIAWKDDVLLFSNLKFGHILRKLERHFDVTIDNKYVELNENRYTGVFETETIEQVLTSLSKIRPFTCSVKGTHFEIKE